MPCGYPRYDLGDDTLLPASWKRNKNFPRIKLAARTAQPRSFTLRSHTAQPGGPRAPWPAGVDEQAGSTHGRLPLLPQTCSGKLASSRMLKTSLTLYLDNKKKKRKRWRPLARCWRKEDKAAVLFPPRPPNGKPVLYLAKAGLPSSCSQARGMTPGTEFLRNKAAV